MTLPTDVTITRKEARDLVDLLATAPAFTALAEAIDQAQGDDPENRDPVTITITGTEM